MDDENPYAAPQAELDESDFVLEGDPSIVRKGQKLAVPVGALLPTRCVKCNRPAHKPFVVKTSSGLSPNSTAVCVLTLMGGMVLLLFFVFYVVNLLWLLLPVAACIAAVVYLERNAPRPIKTTFYICSKHQFLNRIGSSIWLFALLPVIAGGWLDDYLDFSLSDYYDIPYVIVLVVLVSFSSSLTLRIVGKMGNAESHEFKGFGKKYLESFPESDDT